MLYLLNTWIFASIFAMGFPLVVQAQIQTYPTYFPYSPKELDPLRELSSSFQIEKEALKKWDDFTRNLLVNKPLQNSGGDRLYAYLYTAQRDAAFLSFNTQGNFSGSLDPISFAVIKLFFPGEEISPNEFQADEFSNHLAYIVFTKIRERFDKENAGLKNYEIKTGELLWHHGNLEHYGLNIGNWNPWLISSSSEFRAPAPPAPEESFWKIQANLTKNYQKNLNEKQKQAILFWAGRTDPESGDWRKIANDFMFSHDVPLAKMLLVRAVLTEGMCDTDMAVFDSKYSYWIRRPHMVDSSIKSPIKVPNHPSYPSGHSTISGFSATLLSYYFPQESDHWYEMAEEAGYSRLWAGIHFPIDHQAGFQMGKKIAQTITKMPKSNL